MGCGVTVTSAPFRILWARLVMAAANDVLPKHEGVEVVYFAGIPLAIAARQLRAFPIFVW